MRNDLIRKIAVFSVVLIIVIGTLAGCSGVSTPQSAEDLSKSDQLVIYVGWWDQYWMQICVNAFRQHYPDVDVKVEVIGNGIDFDYQQYTDRVSNELMAGSGPDIIVYTPTYFDNVHKMVNNGTFLDLSGVIDNDADVNMNDFCEAVMEDCLYESSGGLVPLDYTLPTLTGVERVLSQVGYDAGKAKNTVTFVNQLTDILEHNPDVVQALDYDYSIYCYIKAAHLQLVDYTAGTADLDKGQIQTLCDVFKAYYAQSLHETYINTSSADLVSWLLNGKALFHYVDYGLSYIDTMSAIQTTDIPVATTIPSMTGGVNARVNYALAINANSPNQLNAYNFIKIALSDEFQANRSHIAGIPVRKSAQEVCIHYIQDNYYEDGLEQDGQIYTRISDEKCDELAAMLEPDSCAISYRTEDGLFYEIMEPYWKGEKSFDECYGELQQRLIILASE